VLIIVFFILAVASFGGLINVANASSASIKIISPASGAVWEIGKTYTIKWKASGVDKVGVYIYNYNESVGGSGMTNYVTPGGLELFKASKGSYDWTIQQNQLLSYNTRDIMSFKIKIHGYNSNGDDIALGESKKFTIIPANTNQANYSTEQSSKTTQRNFSAGQCTKVQQKSNERITFFADKKEKHMAVYTNLVDRINKFIIKADGAKLDTTAINGNLVELQIKIDKFKQDSDAFSAKLIVSIEEIASGCQNPKGFKGKLSESRILLEKVHADAADIRVYVRETILPNLQSLKVN